MEGAMSYDRDVVESLMATELRLGLPGTDEKSSGTIRGIKRTLDEDSRSETKSPNDAAGSTATEEEDEVAPPKAKTQVVGWPPVRSYRKSTFQARKATEAEAASATLVKVSMDGAPYLRKIELKTYKGYKELREALESMFKSFSLGKISAATEGGCNGGSEYAITYEDKDGDWMLVGDVPWGMFTSSCKRLRIMRGSEARGFGNSH